MPQLAVIAALMVGDDAPEPTIPTYSVTTMLVEVQGVTVAAADPAALAAATAFVAAVATAMEAAHTAAQADDLPEWRPRPPLYSRPAPQQSRRLAAGQRWA